MKQLPATDRRSWTFQAAIHGTDDPTATDPLFNQCQHGTIQFFTWHRGYLHFFERILRWAAGDPALNLPYWDWSATPVLPEPYRVPADPTLNPLYEPKRKANDGSALPANVVITDLQTALQQTAFPTAGANGFSPDLEGSPHGQVHVLVGGLGGLMSHVPTAAGDSIFWLHHANIDRLWNVWLNQGGGRANPTDPAFLDQPYTFADETGGTATVLVRDIISSAGLGYRYDDVPNPAAQFLQEQPKAATPTPPATVATSAPPERREEALEKAQPKPLGFREERVKLNVVKENRAALAGPIQEGQAGAPKVMVTVEGLSADEAPDFVFGVYLNLPEGERKEDVLRKHYVGSINFFGKTRADRRALGHGHGAEFNATFDATRVLAELQKSGALTLENIAVTILPTAPTPPGVNQAQLQTKAEGAAKRANVIYKRISMQVIPGKP
jgi:tyrosinase